MEIFFRLISELLSNGFAGSFQNNATYSLSFPRCTLHSELIAWGFVCARTNECMYEVLGRGYGWFRGESQVPVPVKGAEHIGEKVF